MKHGAGKSSLVVAIAMSLVLAASAHAQFTAVVPPPPRKAPPPSQAQKVAKADSVSRQTLSDMKTWVDSAAASLGASSMTDTVADTMRDTVPLASTTTTTTSSATRTTTESSGTLAFRQGAPAPATATNEPMLFVLGIGALSIGAVLLRRHA